MSERWRLGDLAIDVGAQTIRRANEEIALPHLSFKFLLALVRAAPNVVSADDLMAEVWAGIFVNSETVTQRAKLLRDALGDDPREPRYFAVRRGVGYQLLDVPVAMAEQSETGPGPSRRIGRGWKLALGALALVVAGAGSLAGLHYWQNAAAPLTEALRVAVLPFDNLSGDPADAFIARSIPEMVLNRLSTMRGLDVISRDSALLSKPAGAEPRKAGETLDADYVVKGSVQRHGSTLRVTCYVVDTAKGVYLWSERFDWPADRLYALQDRIAERVAASLAARTRGLGALAPAQIETRNTDAYLAYLKGKAELGRFTVAESDTAAGFFEKAVALDPRFAPALVALFDARMQAADLRKEDLDPVRARYEPLLERALALDPNSGEALFARAMWSNLPRHERLALYREAATRDPSNARGLVAFAELLQFENTTRDSTEWAEGERIMDRVRSVDPLSPRTLFWTVQRQLGILTPDQLEAEQAKAIELDPTNFLLVNRYANRRWMFHGETAEAIELTERVIASDPQNPAAPHYITAYYLDANDPAAAHAIATSTPASRDSTRPILAQYAGDWRSAGEAALGPRGFLFNSFQNWLWAESVRDYALHTDQYDRCAEAIGARFGFDLKQPRTTNLQQSTAAIALAHILIASGKEETGRRLLVQTIHWVDSKPFLGMVGTGKTKANALMLLGQKDEAISTLTATMDGAKDRRMWWYFVERDPVWAPMHNDPRFKSLAARLRAAAAIERSKLDRLRQQGRVPPQPGKGRT